MAIIQKLDGYREVDLKNYLFCAINGLNASRKICTFPNKKVVGRDVAIILRIEKRLNKPFDKITLCDLLNSDYRSMYTHICENIFFRYFNLELIKAIVAHSGLSMGEIADRYRIQYSKAQGLSQFIFNDEAYFNKYKGVK